ncbi:hypothetical protein V6C27_03705 [Peptococcaceae bacterium 1198_IL3148]
MITVEPKSGNIGLIKAPHAAKATGITLYSPDFEPIYNELKKLDVLIGGSMTGKFDDHWEYSPEEDAYLLILNYFQGKAEFAIKFPKARSGQILQAVVEQGQRVVTMVLKYKQDSHKLFDDAVVLMGIELEILPEAGWPVIND